MMPMRRLPPRKICPWRPALAVALWACGGWAAWAAPTPLPPNRMRVEHKGATVMLDEPPTPQPPASAPSASGPVAPSTVFQIEMGEPPSAASAAAKPPGELKTLMDLIEASKSAYEELENPASGSPAQRASQVSGRIKAVAETLEKFDRMLTSGEEHWEWSDIKRVEATDQEPDREKFVIDPPLRDGAAVSFWCKKKTVDIEWVKVIDARGAATRFQIGRSYSFLRKKREVCYLYYPTKISTVVVKYGSESQADDRLHLVAGVTDLPEYAKQAIYWYRMAMRNLEGQPNLAKASYYIKQAIRNVYLFRFSRQRQ